MDVNQSLITTLKSISQRHTLGGKLCFPSIFMYNLYICFMNFKSFAHFIFTDVVCLFFLLNFKCSLYILYRSHLSVVLCKYFPPVLSLSSHILNIFFQRAEVFTFEKVLFGFFFLLWLKFVCLFVYVLEIFAFSKITFFSKSQVQYLRLDP